MRKGSPELRGGRNRSFALMITFVIEANNNYLVCCFQNSVPLELVVEEELPIGSRIGDVQAIDEDEGDNAVIEYAIIG